MRVPTLTFSPRRLAQLLLEEVVEREVHRGGRRGLQEVRPEAAEEAPEAALLDDPAPAREHGRRAVDLTN